ncbi:MAG: hypothetical protein OXF50_04740 [Caldilineaceae bacterium]|nr:hypothetical protein [Caldilineaceae bacterium]
MPLGVAGQFRVGRRLGIETNTVLAAKRLDGGQKPSFKLSMGDHDLGGHVSGCLYRPILDSRAQLCGAVGVPVEQDNNSATVGLE